MNNGDYEYRVAKIKSGQVGYLAIGDDSLAPMILLVGYSGNLLHWNKQFVENLAKHYRVYLLDNRLVGKTNSGNEESICGMATDVFEFIQSLQLNSVNLVGWSMGGMIAQGVAINYPNVIASITLLGSLPDYSFTHGSLHALVATLREKPSKESRDKIFHLFYSEELSIDFRKYLARNILRISNYNYPYNSSAQLLQDKAVTSYNANYEQLKQLTQPTIIVTAKNDLVNKPEASHLLHQLIPNSRLISFASGGHFFVNVFPLDVAAYIIKFLDRANNVKC